MIRKNMNINSDGLVLEACLNLPDNAADPCPGVVLCHPNPVYGGDMHNSIILAVSRALTAKGIACLRYNSRGVGHSQGVFGGGLPEREDGRAAVSFLAGQTGIDPNRMGIMGYSFGGSIALPVGGESSSIKAIAAVSPVVPPGSLTDCPKPKLIICGGADDFVPTDQVLRESDKMSDPKTVKVFSDMDHFWWGHEDAAAELVAEFMAEHLT